jgi:hypothetical protein
LGDLVAEKRKKLFRQALVHRFLIDVQFSRERVLEFERASLGIRGVRWEEW